MFALAAELAVYTKMPGPVVEIVTLAVKPPVVTTLAFSKIGPRKLDMFYVVVLAIVIESTNLSLVIDALTILFALIAVKPSFGPVIAPSAISEAITVPSAMESAVTLFNGILVSLFRFRS